MKREPLITAGKAPKPQTRREREAAGTLAGVLGKQAPRDVTDTPIGVGLLPDAAHRIGVGERAVELIAGLWGKVSGHWNVPGVVILEDPYD